MDGAVIGAVAVDHSACPQCGFPLDGGAPGAVPCPTCGEHVHGKYCLHCGTEISSGQAFGVHVKHGRASVRAAKVALGPIAEYAEHARSIVRPSRLIHEIRNGHFTWIETLGFWVAAAAITALLGAFLPSPIRRFELPIVGEVLEALMVMTVTVVCNAPLHLLLRRGRRDVTFREFLITTLAIGALLYPWVALIYGILMRAGMRVDVVNNINTLWSSLFYILAYAKLYRRSFIVSLGWFIAYVMAAAITILSMVMLVIAVARLAGVEIPVKAKPAPAAAEPARE